MAVSGTVTSYNPHKGWGFIECNGKDVFVNRRECGGHCLSKGMSVSFTVTQGEKGQQATEVKVLVPPEEAVYHGEVKSFNPNKGYGFIGCDAFPGQDVFVLKSEIPGGFAPQGGHCKFKVKQESEKGPAATEVQLLGAAGNQYQQMKQMAFYSGFKGFGKAKGFFKGKGPRVDPSHKAPGRAGRPERVGKMLEHMNQAGKAKWVEVFEGKGAGTGTAAYGSTEEVAQAINMLNGTPLGGSQITVDAWVKAPKEDAPAA
ncbi:unnamed protein product [Durusdinium trenchii]|uniref:Cold shock-like protein CspA n=2 Tax=Durusdinium trenchii TaxID=1381693 RepID=A0ABP0RXE1_9DINO